MHKSSHTNDPTHTVCRDGIFYYHRRVPLDLMEHYGKTKLCFSLRTKSRAAAFRAASSITQKLDDYWMGIRLQQLDIPALAVVRDMAKPTCKTKLSDALELYLRLKGVDKSKTFAQTTDRAYRYVIECLGDRALDAYSSSEAASFRDWLLLKGLSIVSVKRSFSVIRSMVNLAIREQGLDCQNAFLGTFMPEEHIEKRKPIPIDHIRNIQKECMRIDDDMRHLIALISDTGMRLSEAAGLRIGDIKIDEDIPYIDLQPHNSRRLKTFGSERQIPLIGASLWAAQRILYSAQSVYAFPRYTNQQRCNSNSASAALNKWLRDFVPDKCVIHSFRHSLRDRLVEIGCPVSIIDQLGGWTPTSVGERYGSGVSLKTSSDWMLKLRQMP